MDFKELRLRLKEIKEYARKRIKEKIETQELFELSWILGPHTYGPLLEKWLIEKLSLIKLNMIDGDAIDQSGNIYEIKVSMSDKGTFNLVQIRNFHAIDYYVMLFVDMSKDEPIGYLCSMTAKEMHDLSESWSAAHGNKKANQGNKNIEKRVTVKYGSDLWNTLIEDSIIIR